MPELTIVYGNETKIITVPEGTIIGNAIIKTGLPFEQPCAGRGTCGKCKLLVEAGIQPPGPIEKRQLTPGELALDNRLACCASIKTDTRVLLSPIVVYSNKNFRASLRYKETSSPLGLAIDLGSTTAAAFLAILEDGEVCSGAASLNQQTIFGADVISRLKAAMDSPGSRERLHRLALASINQAVDALKMSSRTRSRIERVTIVCNVAMHHLLTRLPIDTLAMTPFEPYDKAPILDAGPIMEGIFSRTVRVSLPPLIGGFVGSDSLACLAYFNFDQALTPMLAIDLGTNGEVLVTNGKRILTASTAAGPAFEGVNISCGTRAVDGAITRAVIDGDMLRYEIIGDVEPIGLTGSGLLSLVHELRKVGVIAESGKIEKYSDILYNRGQQPETRVKQIFLTPQKNISLTQWDIRELQKAKGAIRAAIEILMKKLELQPGDFKRVILTGSFGGQIDIEAALGLGMIPPVDRQSIEAIPNGAGLGAAMFLSDSGFARGVALAASAKQVNLDQESGFATQYIQAMALKP